MPGAAFVPRSRRRGGPVARRRSTTRGGLRGPAIALKASVPGPAGGWSRLRGGRAGPLHCFRRTVKHIHDDGCNTEKAAIQTPLIECGE
jgi:hypothetical protein